MSLSTFINNCQEAIFKYKNDPTIEIEGRLGNYYKNNRGDVQFNSSVNQNVWYRMLEYFKRYSHVYNGIVTESTDKIYTHKDHRGKYRETTNNVSKAVTWSFKNPIKNIDFNNFYSRVAFSTENILQGPQDIPTSWQHTDTREKLRYSFTTDHQVFNKLQIDMTRSKLISRNNYIKVQYEIELEVIDREITATELWNALNYLIKLIQRSDTPITETTRENIVKQYNNLINGGIVKDSTPVLPFGELLENPSNKPINFPRNLIGNEKLAVTDKADGERKLMFVNSDGITILLYPPYDITPFCIDKAKCHQNKAFVNSIIDGELVDDENGNKLYLIFDILFYRGQDVRNQPFSKRWAMIKDANLFGSRVKNFIMPSPKNTFATRISKIYEYIQTQKYCNDGIIIVNVDSKYTDPVYKWKPVELLTIDFICNIRDSDPTKIDLYVIENNTNKDRKMFLGTPTFPFSGSVYISGGEPKIEPFVSKTTCNITIDPKTIRDGQIIELSFEKDTADNLVAKLHRIRLDRDQPNFMQTAINIWNDIMNPILYDELLVQNNNPTTPTAAAASATSAISATVKPLEEMRRLKNLLKREMIQEYATSPTLDIGSGRGGDLDKWFSANMQVLAVEPNENNINTFINERIPNQKWRVEKPMTFYKNESRVALIKAVGQDTATIVKGLQSHYNVNKVNLICMFDVLTFFFESEGTLDQLINTINTCLDNNGYFIGMVMDGASTEKLLQKQDTLKYKDWQMKKLYDSASQDVFGKKIEIVLDNTIVGKQIEYLTYFDTLVEKLGRVNIKLINTVQFSSKNVKMDKEQAILNNLYRSFVFQKVSSYFTPTPPLLESPPTHFVNMVKALEITDPKLEKALIAKFKALDKNLQNWHLLRDAWNIASATLHKNINVRIQIDAKNFTTVKYGNFDPNDEITVTIVNGKLVKK